MVCVFMWVSYLNQNVVFCRNICWHRIHSFQQLSSSCTVGCEGCRSPLTGNLWTENPDTKDYRWRYYSRFSNHVVLLKKSNLKKKWNKCAIKFYHSKNKYEFLILGFLKTYSTFWYLFFLGKLFEEQNTNIYQNHLIILTYELSKLWT
jgi:hypothetical protein